MGEYKEFSPELKEKYDFVAKLIAIDYFNNVENYSLTINPDEKGVDLIGKIFVECDCKPGWNTNECFYPTLYIPERKLKYVTGRTKFFSVNGIFTRAGIIEDSLIKKDFFHETPNKHIPRGEFSFCIPIHLIKFVETPNGRRIAEEYFKSIGKNL